MHSCKHGNRTQTTLFLRGQNRFASQFSANHIQFRIAKLRFCIANCDAIPDKFIPVRLTGCPEEAYQKLEGRILVWKLTAKDSGSFLVASVHGRHIGLTNAMKRTEQNLCRQALRTLCHTNSLQLVIGADWNIVPKTEPGTPSEGFTSPKKNPGRGGMIDSIELVSPDDNLADKIGRLTVGDTPSSTPQTPKKMKFSAGYNLMKVAINEDGDLVRDNAGLASIFREEQSSATRDLMVAYDTAGDHTPMVGLVLTSTFSKMFVFDYDSLRVRSVKDGTSQKSSCCTITKTTTRLKTLSYGDVARLLPSPGKVNACNRSMRMQACSVA